MKIASFIRPELIVPSLRATSRTAALEELSRHLAAHEPGVDAVDLAQRLEERERLSSTGIGEGVAVPHVKAPGVRELAGVLARSAAGVDFAAIDGLPAHLIFLVVVPEGQAGTNLRALARISLLASNPEWRERLLSAEGADGMAQVLAEFDAAS